MACENMFLTFLYVSLKGLKKLSCIISILVPFIPSMHYSKLSIFFHYNVDERIHYPHLTCKIQVQAICVFSTSLLVIFARGLETENEQQKGRGGQTLALFT